MEQNRVLRRQPRRCRAKSASKLVPRCGYSLEGLPVRHRCPSARLNTTNGPLRCRASHAARRACRRPESGDGSWSYRRVARIFGRRADRNGRSQAMLAALGVGAIWAPALRLPSAHEQTRAPRRGDLSLRGRSFGFCADLESGRGTTIASSTGPTSTPSSSTARAANGIESASCQATLVAFEPNPS